MTGASDPQHPIHLVMTYDEFDIDAKLNIVPVLASSYAWTDSKTLLIRLRPDVQFQNGEKFDADAVKYTLERDLSANGSRLRMTRDVGREPATVAEARQILGLDSFAAGRDGAAEVARLHPSSTGAPHAQA